MANTLKRPGQEPKRDLSGTTVHIAEYDRASLRMIHSWPVGEYPMKSEATRARAIVTGLLAAEFPDAAHSGTRALTEKDVDGLRQALAERLAVPPVV